MTEKRYILSHNGKEDGIRDKTNDKGYYGFELARLVNELSEENEQLRKELGSFEQVSFTELCDGSRTVLYMKKENVGDVE
jgi:hypothetical protein